jgi:Ca2+-binding RTX toxin-like protein
MWRFDGAAPGDQAGTSIDAAGDVNADGLTDLVVGSPFADRSPRTDVGSVRVFYGGSMGGTTDLATTGAPGFKAQGGSTNDNSGISASFVGDANGDGRGDLVVGAPRADRLGRGDNGSSTFLWGYGPSQLAYPGSIGGAVGQPVAPAAPEAIVRTGVVSFSIDPALPAGMSLDSKTGVIGGVPSVIVDVPTTYRLTMTDFAGSVSVPLTLRVAPAPGRCANPRDGSPQDDNLAGTSGGDRVDAQAGNDTVQAVGGDDCITGQVGLDKLFGGEGSDELRGGSEHDELDGGEGNDALFGDEGQDALVGGTGLDALHGGSGYDELNGGPGGDQLFGEADSDVLRGGDGDDRITGGDSADRLIGGGGKDVMEAGGGNDIVTDSRGSNRINAGGGADVISVRNGSRDVVNCAAGRDRVSADRGDKLKNCEQVRRAGAKKKSKKRKRRKRR